MKLKKRSECEVSIGEGTGWVYFTPAGEGRRNHWAFGPNGEKYRRVLSSEHMIPCTNQEWEDGR